MKRMTAVLILLFVVVGSVIWAQTYSEQEVIIRQTIYGSYIVKCCTCAADCQEEEFATLEEALAMVKGCFSTRE